MVLRVLLFIAILFAVLFALRQALLMLRGQRKRSRRAWGKPAQDRSLEEARRRLGVEAGASQDDIRAAFRAKAARAHPDAGGETAEWRALVRARDLLLSKADRTGRRG